MWLERPEIWPLPTSCKSITMAILLCQPEVEISTDTSSNTTKGSSGRKINDSRIKTTWLPIFIHNYILKHIDDSFALTGVLVYAVHIMDLLVYHYSIILHFILYSSFVHLYNLLIIIVIIICTHIKGESRIWKAMCRNLNYPRLKVFLSFVPSIVTFFQISFIRIMSV